MDYMVKDYNTIRSQTEKERWLFEDEKLITLYSGVADSVTYNITDEYGNLNVAVNQKLVVSGYFSTTTDKNFAISWGQGMSVAAKNPIILFIRPLAHNSKAAFLDIAIGGNQQKEMLFPTNVKFTIDKIYTPSDPEMDPDAVANNFYYQIWLNETETENIQPEVDGSDPRKDEYVCEEIDPSERSESSKSSESSKGSKSSESNKGSKGSESSETSKNTENSVITISTANRPLVIICPLLLLLLILYSWSL